MTIFYLKNFAYKIFFWPAALGGEGECIYGIVFPVAHCEKLNNSEAQLWIEQLYNKYLNNSD